MSDVLTPQEDVANDVSIALLNQSVANLTTLLAEHKKSHDALTQSVVALNKTWNQAMGILGLIKWLAMIGAAVGAMITAALAVFHYRPHP